MRVALLIADAGDERRAAQAALAVSGIEVMADTDFADASAALATATPVDLIAIEAAGVDWMRLEPVLAVANARGYPMVVTLDEDQIDFVAGPLLGTRAQLLCSPTPEDRVQAIARGVARDFEAVRINTALREPAHAYRGPEAPFGDITAAEIRATIRARQMRSQFFAGDLFADPAWDMLLDLFAATLERRQVSVSSLCIAAAVPPTTALRWIGALHDSGLFERQPDPFDRRRAHIALSAKGIEAMQNYFGAVKRAGLPLA